MLIFAYKLFLMDCRKFIHGAVLTGIAQISMGNSSVFIMPCENAANRIGIIGLDTYHSLEFVKSLNKPGVGLKYGCCRVVIAYAYRNRDIQTSFSRISGYTNAIKEYGG